MDLYATVHRAAHSVSACDSGDEPTFFSHGYTVLPDRFNCLVVLSSRQLQKLDLKDIVNDFATKKVSADHNHTYVFFQHK